MICAYDRVYLESARITLRECWILLYMICAMIYSSFITGF